MGLMFFVYWEFAQYFAIQDFQIRIKALCFFFFYWQIALPFAVHDSLAHEIQDLNPECRKGTIQMVQLYA